MNELAGIFKDTRKHLMNGVSHMIPFVVTGGILMAVAVMAYGQGGVPPEGTWMATLWNFGSTALNLMVPVKKVKVPKALSSIMPIMIIPIVGSLVTMGFM